MKQAAKILDLLELYARHGEPISAADISDRFDWPRSTTFGLLAVLTDRGFLYEAETRGRFYPTRRWLLLAQEFSPAEPLPPALVDLADEIADHGGEDTCIAAQAGLHAVVLHMRQSGGRTGLDAAPGSCVPVHATAAGQALLSQVNPVNRAALLRKIAFERYAPRTPMTPAKVEEAIAMGLQRGWFAARSTWMPDMCDVAIPLTMDGSTYAVVTGGPTVRTADRLDELGRVMRDCVARMRGVSLHMTEAPAATPIPAMAPSGTA